MSLLMVLLPLFFCLAVNHKQRVLSRWLVALAPLPCLILALSGQQTALQLPYLFLGLEWTMQGWRQTLLAMTSLLWLLAGVSATATLSQQIHQQRYIRCWLLTLCGNLGLIVSSDITSFYAFFALMTFAAYGLVIQSGSKNALQAGRVYLIMAVFGEALLLAGLLMAAGLAEHAAPIPQMTDLALLQAQHQTPVISLLLFLGFGVKAGVAGLHWWLPLAHPAAPPAASAVLSGAMIKGGLLGWLLVLPVGQFSGLVDTHLIFNPLATSLVYLGFIAVFAGALSGMVQRRSKTVLAYSSISQMGLLTLTLGLGWLYPQSWPALGSIIIVYAVHHGLCKGALFLASGIAHKGAGISRNILLFFASLPALSLAGFPLTTGYAAKILLKHEIQPLELEYIALGISLSALATSALMLRYLQRLYREFNPDSGQSKYSHYAFFATVVLSFVSLIILPLGTDINLQVYYPSAQWWSGIWPVLLTGLAGLAWWVTSYMRHQKGDKAAGVATDKSQG